MIEFSMNIHIKILYQLWIKRYPFFTSNIVSIVVYPLIVDWLVECETIYSIKDNDNLDQYNMLCK